jgi:four helix bundle protein
MVPASARVNSYRDLVVWQKAMTLAEQCYKLTERFPRQEQFGLTAQLRRSAVSIPSNVAEGHAGASTATYARHVGIAVGSHAELETQTELALRLGFLERERAGSFLELLHEVGCMLATLHAAIRRRVSAGKSR